MFLITHILLTSSLLCIVMGRHLDFRERFLERKRLRSIKDQRITALNNYVLNNTEVLDDIAHYRKIKGRSSPAWKKVRAIEKDFRRLLAMKGMKYIYKRDLFWRTWRSIPPVNGDNKQIVSYKCNNPIHSNEKECQNCGMWTIEDRTPPCPFEFFTVLSDEKLCGANFTQYKDVSNICPSVIKFSDLTATCDNPIETQWRFTKMYGVTEKYDEVICKDKDFCEIFTSYEITPEHVIFRIINSTNDVIYSRIMKAKNRNYICVEDCGRFNPNTRKVVKADKPLKLDLLTVRKTKREDVLNEINDNVTKRDVLNEMNNMQMHWQTKRTKGEGVSNEMNDNAPKREDVLNEMNESLHLPTKLTKEEDASNEMNDNDPKREDVLIEMRYSLHLPKKFTKVDISNEMNDSAPKREDVLNEINESLHLPTKLPKGDGASNEMNDNVPKSDVFNEMNDTLHLPTKLTKGDVSNEMNDKVPKRQDVFSEMNDSLHLPTKLTKGDVTNEMNDNVPKREDVLSEMNDRLHLPTELTKGDVSNEISDNVPKREDVLNEINDSLHLLTKLTKGDVSNEINDNVPKRDVLNEMKDSLHLPTKLAKGDFSNEIEMNEDNVPKREDVMNEMNDSLHLPTKLTKGDVSNEINDNLPKRDDVLNEMNDSLHLLTKLTKGDVSNEINDNVPKREDLMNEINDTLQRTHLPTKLTKGDVSNEINDNLPKREDVMNEMNESLHLPIEVTETEEVLSDILPPMEENMSLSFGGDEYVRDSIEITRPQIDWYNGQRMMSIDKRSPHQIKSRGMKEGQQSNTNSVVEKRFVLKPTVEKRFLLKPTVTPRQKLKKEADDISYEYVNLQTE